MWPRLLPLVAAACAACAGGGGAATPDSRAPTGDLADGPTLVTTNDDGGADQGTPHVFTRTGCSR